LSLGISVKQAADEFLVQQLPGGLAFAEEE